MGLSNDIFSLSMENVDLHFIIHAESFLQNYNQSLGKVAHSHVYCEILFSLDGSSALILENQEIQLEANAFALIRPYRAHSTQISNAAGLFSIGFYYEQNQNKYARNDLYTLLEQLVTKHDAIGIPDQGLRELFLQLRDFHRTQDIISEGMMITTFSAILYSVLAILKENPSMTDGQQNSVRKPYSPHGISFEVLYQINDILNNHYTEDITPELLSKQFYISPKQINRYVFNQYGKTFLQRRTALRMTVAQKLLCHTDDPIGSISKAVGYQSINTFYSAFKTFCGITPDQYRKEFSEIP